MPCACPWCDYCCATLHESPDSVRGPCVGFAWALHVQVQGTRSRETQQDIDKQLQTTHQTDSTCIATPRSTHQPIRYRAHRLQHPPGKPLWQGSVQSTASCYGVRLTWNGDRPLLQEAVLLRGTCHLWASGCVHQRTLPGLAPILASLGECAHQQAAHMMYLLCHCRDSARPQPALSRSFTTGDERRDKRQEKKREEKPAEQNRTKQSRGVVMHAKPWGYYLRPIQKSGGGEGP
ncbi:hypothetical protein ACQKWADRAFT_73842 [Trichoderma austrokoningii]